MTESERREHLAEVGHNLFRLASARVRFDLFSDVAERVLVPRPAQGSPEASPDEVREALAPLTGDARLALATKGRAAEIALVDALELAGPVVLTHGLFSTTQAALARRAAVLEDLRLARPSGSADIDLDHLEDRLTRGGVQLVYLEVANNALFGWPLSHANVAAVRASCDRHGAKLVIDAARPWSPARGEGRRFVWRCRCSPCSTMGRCASWSAASLRSSRGSRAAGSRHPRAHCSEPRAAMRDRAKLRVTRSRSCRAGYSVSSASARSRIGTSSAVGSPAP